MSVITIREDIYRDKVMGCWFGKNAGGTLGAPIEKIWGSREPFNLDYYMQEIPEGGLPNDDLEIQLIWLMALEERGLGITCRDLAEYWLNHVGYNPDEYGFHKLNLRQGLLPPVSGWYNNPFKHNMGCPIRSEIWACIAPALPDVALSYAWEDAVCDHAGGESVNGELFNAAVESAAFVISDRDTLLDIGLSVIPADCLTARAIREARKAHQEGLSWLEARNRVMNAVFNLNGQYSPINMGYQTIGWLYGEDFGDALCKAVNCGWDTDCTGATLGAILGIIHGARALPEKWIRPLGKKIAVTPPPGIVDVNLPADIDELTDRSMAVGRRLLASFSSRIQITNQESIQSELTSVPIDFNQVKKVHSRPQNAVIHTLSAIEVVVTYPDMPAISEFDPVTIRLEIRNRGTQPIKGIINFVIPKGYTSPSEGIHHFHVEGQGSYDFLPFSVKVRDSTEVRTTNTAWIQIRVDKHPCCESIPVVMVGKRKWLVSSLFADATLETVTPPPIRHEESDNKNWMRVAWAGNELLLENFFEGRKGVLCLRQYAWNPEARLIRFAVANNHRMQLFVNGQERKKTSHPVPCHPSFWGDCDPVLQWDDIHINTCDVELPRGWNHFLVLIERGEEPMRAFFNLSYDPRLLHGCDDIEQSRFPWEAPDRSQEPVNW